MTHYAEWSLPGQWSVYSESCWNTICQGQIITITIVLILSWCQILPTYSLPFHQWTAGSIVLHSIRNLICGFNLLFRHTGANSSYKVCGVLHSWVSTAVVNTHDLCRAYGVRGSTHLIYKFKNPLWPFWTTSAVLSSSCLPRFDSMQPRSHS